MSDPSLGNWAAIVSHKWYRSRSSTLLGCRSWSRSSCEKCSPTPFNLPISATRISPLAGVDSLSDLDHSLCRCTAFVCCGREQHVPRRKRPCCVCFCLRGRLSPPPPSILPPFLCHQPSKSIHPTTPSRSCRNLIGEDGRQHMVLDHTKPIEKYQGTTIITIVHYSLYPSRAEYRKLSRHPVPDLVVIQHPRPLPCTEKSQQHEAKHTHQAVGRIRVSRSR